jgi:predicted RNA binding protein YcfA (HicA-like mRNA interferase family)
VTSFPAVKGKDLISALRGAGFVVVRTKGSHHFVRHSDGRATVVPVHAGEHLVLGSWQASCVISSSRVNSCRSCFDGSAI